MTESHLTPPALAERWGVAPEKILGFIRTGTLRAFDVRGQGSTRPRYRIPLDAIVEFESRRSARRPVKAARRTRQKQAADYVKYF